MWSSLVARRPTTTTTTTVITRTLLQTGGRQFRTTAFCLRKPGVSEPADLRAFVATHADQIRVIDVRGPDEGRADGPLPVDGKKIRPQALNLVWDRAAKSMPLPAEYLPKDTPLITHCGGGGRGQKSCDFLKAHGYTNVVNGGGPEDEECWKEFGHL